MKQSIEMYLTDVANALFGGYDLPSYDQAYYYILKQGPNVWANISHDVTAERTAFDIAISERLKASK